MDWLTGGKHFGSKPLIDVNIRNNQTVFQATGLEKARSHSNYLMDELMGHVAATEAAANSVSIEWCGKKDTILEGNRYMQVITNISTTPTEIWLLLPGVTPIPTPDAAMIEKCCCDGEQSNEVLTAVLDIHTELEPGGYTVLTTGSRNAQADNIETDSNYRYTDTYEIVPDGVNSLGIILKVTALGGETISFDWTDSLITNPVDQSAMEALLNSVQGYMDATNGYIIGKIGMQNILKNYLSTNTNELPHITGGQWKVSRTVELVADTGVNGSATGDLAQGMTSAKYSSPTDVARFKYNSNNSTGLFVADHDNHMVCVVYDLENEPISLVAHDYGSTDVHAVMVNDAETVNGYPVVYVLLDNGNLRKLTRNTTNDYVTEANNWDDALVISLAPGPTFATIDPTRTGNAGSPIFFVGMQSAFGLLQVVQDTGAGYTAASLEDTGSVLDSAADAYQVEDIQVHTNGDLYYILRGVADTNAAAIILAQLTGLDISTPSDWTHTLIVGSLVNRGDTSAASGTDVRFFRPSGLFITGTIDTTGPILHVADRDNATLKKIVPTSGQDITIPSNWSQTIVAGNGTLSNDEGSGLTVSLPDLICGHYYPDEDAIYVTTDLYNKIFKISGIAAGTYDKTNVVGVNGGQLETVIW